MNSWVFAIVTSLVATAIWELLGRYFKKIKTPLGILLSIIRKDYYIKYNSFEDFKVKKYIRLGVKNSTSIKYFSIRGFPLTHEEFELRKAILDPNCFNPQRNKEFKVLISDPDGEEAKERALEFVNIRSTAESVETYLEQIKQSFNALIDLKNTISKLEIKIHNNPALYRIIIFDEFCLIGFYTDEINGLISPAIVFKKNNIFYSIFNRYFKQTWERSIERKKKY